MWAPDVYEGAPTSVTALIATGSKAAVFAALIRLLVVELRPLQADWTVLLWALAALTMTVGNVVAIAQSNLKRMLAYSSIAHVGYMLVGVVLLLGRGGTESVGVNQVAGLAARHPLLALVLTVFLLSLIGIPPTAGFVGKFYLFGGAVQTGFKTRWY